MGIDFSLIDVFVSLGLIFIASLAVVFVIFARRGVTPLHLATMFSNPAVVKALLDAGAKIKARLRVDGNPWAWRQYARKITDIVEALLARREGGWTPLHTAAGVSESPDVVKALLDDGANIDARTKGGWAPLHVAAVFSKSPDVVQTLLDGGASPTAKTPDGSTPWDLIQKNGDLKGTSVYWLLNQANYDEEVEEL